MRTASPKTLPISLGWCRQRPGLASIQGLSLPHIDPGAGSCLEQVRCTIRSGMLAGNGGDDWAYLLNELYVRCVLSAGSDKQSHAGTYYTPRWLVDPVVARCLDPLLDAWRDGGTPTPLADAVRILDPAVGTGQLLVVAAQHIVRYALAAFPTTNRTASQWMREIVTECLYAYDVDATVVPLARLALLLLCDAADRPQAEAVLCDHVRVSDALTVPTESLPSITDQVSVQPAHTHTHTSACGALKPPVVSPGHPESARRFRSDVGSPPSSFVGSLAPLHPPDAYATQCISFLSGTATAVPACPGRQISAPSAT